MNEKYAQMPRTRFTLPRVAVLVDVLERHPFRCFRISGNNNVMDK